MSAPARLGDYEIVEEIGRGGFGVVHKARQVSLDRPVALKVLYEHRVHTPEELARFEREARAAARLDHSAIVSVHAWGEDDGTFYIAQKLVGEGRTLADSLAALKEKGEHPKGYFRQIAERLVAVSEGLQHAHDHGIVHRDVKPSNVLLDEQGRPFLGDFGLAKLEDGLELSRTGDFAGSPYYMSPEQADSKRGTVDHRADIYSLGVTLYELLTLQPPFTGNSAHEIIRKILTEDPRPPSKVVDRVPTDLETICLKAMEKGRSRRYQTAHEFAQDLQAFLDGEPISAVPVSTVSRIFRKARRNRAGVGIVVLIAALLGLAYMLQDQGRESRLREGQVETAGSTITTVTEARQDADLVLTEKVSQASTVDEAQKLVAYKSTVDAWLDRGQSLILDGLPDVVDNETLEFIGSSLQTEGIYAGIAAMVEYLNTEGGDGADDPRLAAAMDWLADTDAIKKGSELLDLPVADLLGLTDTAPAVAAPGDIAAAQPSTGGEMSPPRDLPVPQGVDDGPMLPPTGPGGILAPQRAGASHGGSAAEIQAPPSQAAAPAQPEAPAAEAEAVGDVAPDEGDLAPGSDADR